MDTIYQLLPNGLSRQRIECHRNSIALVPETLDPDPGLAILLVDKASNYTSLSCNCRAYQKKNNCPHKNILSGVLHAVEQDAGQIQFDAAFRKSPWYRLAEMLNGFWPVGMDSLSCPAALKYPDASGMLEVFSNDQKLLAYDAGTLAGDDPDSDLNALFLEQTNLILPNGRPFHRGRVFDMLADMTRTPSEAVLNDKNLKSRRQALESSLWYRLTRHCHYLLADPAADGEFELDTRVEKDGGFRIICRTGNHPVFEMFVPREKVMPAVRDLQTHPFWKSPVSLAPGTLESIVKVTAEDDNTLNATLCLLVHLPDGGTHTVERRTLKHFWYADGVYVPTHHLIATWQKPDKLWESFSGCYRKRLRPERIPQILNNIEEFFSPPNIIDETVRKLAIFTEPSRMIISPDAEDRDWCWISVDYGFGENATVSLSEVYQAKVSGNRYLSVTGGWVDTRGIDLEPILMDADNSIARQLDGPDGCIRFSRMDLMRLQAACGKSVEIRKSGTSDCPAIASLLQMVPAARISALPGFSSVLRNYQQRGLEWLAFLYENGFGGVLCDDMGLGKTHQIMGLMVWLKTVKKETAPFLVVCPTTVLSHWHRKIREYAPALESVVYHGPDRQLPKGQKSGQVVITSYGVLTNDLHRLSRMSFSVAAFDEAQYIKNPETKSYQAAAVVPAKMKVAVTGTPIENRLGDLKSLMDLSVPGYLGTDGFFARRYESEGINRRGELKQLVRPFALRRTKETVLSELPEKIEDIRFCRLTQTQVRLYREAVDARRAGLLHALTHEDEAIPYIHIFSLLTLLKQICNHPASVAKEAFDPGKGPLDSGKWELFTELLAACLENERKVVVFSQFVKMIEIINQYLAEKGIGVAGITGQTRNRGKEIDRFNEDEDCRVFVGSLKAGGSGIDLIGGSVVIHYDRWWNAAKEDQATDRVHRIGQTRGVQVFKLVTEGTLEEKISAIIERKRKLMADVITEDDAGSLKTFSREELIDLLSLPDQDRLTVN